MQEPSLLPASTNALRDRLIQYLKKNEVNNLSVANLLVELNTLSDEKKRDLKILEACVCTYDITLLRVLIKHVFLSRDPLLQDAMQNLKINLKTKDDKHPKAWVEICIDKLNAADLNRLKVAFLNLMFIEKASSSKGSILPFLNSYIKTEMSVEKLLKLLPSLMNGPMNKTIMADVLVSIDDTYQHQSAHTANGPGRLFK